MVNTNKEILNTLSQAEIVRRASPNHIFLTIIIIKKIKSMNNNSIKTKINIISNIEKNRIKEIR